MPIFNDSIRKEISDLIGELNNTVNLYLFVSEDKCRTCRDTKQYITEIAELNEKINSKVIDKDEEKA
ncbi:MAG: hypothetical protein R2771_14580 [Saprospiraceae bacterium]